jgi:hypothetical protein
MQTLSGQKCVEYYNLIGNHLRFLAKIQNEHFTSVAVSRDYWIHLCNSNFLFLFYILLEFDQPVQWTFSFLNLWEKLRQFWKFSFCSCCRIPPKCNSLFFPFPLLPQMTCTFSSVCVNLRPAFLHGMNKAGVETEGPDGVVNSLGPTSPLGVNFTPGGQLHPWGSTSPLGANFTPGGQLHPWGPTSPLGANFISGGQLYLWGPTSSLGPNFSPAEIKNDFWSNFSRRDQRLVFYRPFYHRCALWCKIIPEGVRP